MTFLPIVDRELREGSRRRGTYWLRVRVAFLALFIGVGAYVINVLQPMLKLGTVLFWGLGGLALLFCLMAGRRSTADCLSQEKREGTLGLLFLTDLKGYDVVLGKLVATSISGFYALLAILPVLAIPLLAGGMTHGEFWRMALVLVNAFFLSLAIGIFASALSREYRGAMGLNLLLALLLVFAPAGCGLGICFASPSNRFVPPFFYSCPVYSFVLCDDGLYSRLAADFWWSLAVTLLLTWLLVLLACWIVPHTWGDKPAAAPSRRHWRGLGRMIAYGSQAKCDAFRKQALNVNAFYWLAARARLKPAQVWAFLGAAGVWWIQGWLKDRPYWRGEDVFISAGVIINSTLKLWIINEAGQRLSEDRRSGAFELLLATPLTAADFLNGVIRALRRQFLKPLLLVTALELVLALSLARQWSLNAMDCFCCVAGATMLWADVAALVWVSMAAALTCKNQTHAATFTVARILVLPWVAFGTIVSFISWLDFLNVSHWHPGDQAGLGLWFGLGMAADLFFGLRAWHLLRNNFRKLAAQSLLPEPPRLTWWRSLWRGAVWTGRLAARFIPARARKPVFACLAAGAAVGAILLARHGSPSYLPPVLVSMTQSNAPFNVFPGGGGGVFFIMPDGTLWRWGKPGAPQSPRSAVPEQIGTARDWVKVGGAGTHCLGLRADGTIWGWGFSNGRYWPEPQPAIEGHDWVDIGTGQHHAAAVKRDGTLWTWDEPLLSNENHPTRISRGPNTHWVAVYCGNDSTFALRKDGTLWAGGTIQGMRSGIWASSKFRFPTLLCAETNWSALDAGGMAKNQAGELWDIQNALPNPEAGAMAVGSLVSAHWALDRVNSVSQWTRAQVRADGTLWMAQVPWPSISSPSAGDWRKVDARSDWVGVWGLAATGFGLTADGTLWTWGLDLGKDPVKGYESRLRMLQARLTGRIRTPSSQTIYPFSDRPRPLLKMQRK
jgi:hypothetical protein